MKTVKAKYIGESNICGFNIGQEYELKLREDFGKIMVRNLLERKAHLTYNGFDDFLDDWVNIRPVCRKRVISLVEIPTEIYDELREIAKEMKEQSNCGTASPYMYQVQEKKSLPSRDDSDKWVWFDPNELEVIFKHDTPVEEIIDWMVEQGKHSKEQLRECSEWILGEILKVEFGLEKVGTQEVTELSNYFFTGKSCREFIEGNSHNLSDPAPFVTHGYRNPEMKIVHDFLLGLAQ